MEAVRTAHAKGFMRIVASGTPEAIDVSEFAGRYVRVYSPDANVWFNVASNAAMDADGTALDLADYLGDATTESTTSELAGEGTVTPELAAKNTGEQFVAVNGTSVIVDPDSGTAVRVFIKPTSRPGTAI